tara:strand:- start:154 stop:681 length:528 start_codon:yes stop_codon:yes gene_type:complete
MEHRLQLFLTDFVLVIPTIGVLILGLISHQWFAVISRRLFVVYYGGTALLRMGTLYVNVDTRTLTQRFCAQTALVALPCMVTGNLRVAAPSLILVLAHACFERVRRHPFLWLSLYTAVLAHIIPAWYVAFAFGVEAACVCFKTPYTAHAIAIASANAITALHITHINSKPLAHWR